jgi:hypothetical protein
MPLRPPFPVLRPLNPLSNPMLPILPMILMLREALNAPKPRHNRHAPRPLHIAPPPDPRSLAPLVNLLEEAHKHRPLHPRLLLVDLPDELEELGMGFLLVHLEALGEGDRRLGEDVLDAGFARCVLLAVVVLFRDQHGNVTLRPSVAHYPPSAGVLQTTLALPPCR